MSQIINMKGRRKELTSFLRRSIMMEIVDEYGGRQVLRMSSDFLLEKKLMDEAPELHQRVKNSVFVLQNMLDAFLPRFPDYTDHSILHSLDVLNYSNLLLGQDQIGQLSTGECYVLIMACYLHDTGMGVNQKDYEEFSRQIAFGDYFETHDRAEVAVTIRDFHHEYSGLFIRKYADLLEIPAGDILFAIIQVSRGHRRTDLLDEREYPDLMTEYGLIRTAYLAAVIRLADEIDVGADRNPELLFDSSQLTRQKDIEAFGTHESVRHVDVTADSIILHVKPKTPEYVPLLEALNGKIQLDYCRIVAQKRSGLRITQESSVLIYEEQAVPPDSYLSV